MNPVYSVIFSVLIGTVLKQCEVDQTLWSHITMQSDTDSSSNPLLNAEVSSEVALEFQYATPPTGVTWE